MEMNCKCGGQLVKRGKRETRLGNKQLYLCKKCLKKSTVDWPRMRFPESTVMKAVNLYASGLSTAEVKQAVGSDGFDVSRWTIIKWHRKFGK
jgi:hypothetical protein